MKRDTVTCPADHGLMEPIRIAGCEVNHCLTCGGMWFDRTELERILAAPAAARALDIGPIVKHRRQDLKPAKHRTCPRDRTTLTTHHHHPQEHVIIDECAACRGIFLDAGELRDLADHTLHERVKSVLFTRII